jgi:hypothetical protein
MTTKKVKYIGYVIKDAGYWHSKDLVKFTPKQFNVGFKSKKIGSDWLVLRCENVEFVAKETILVTKEITKELI